MRTFGQSSSVSPVAMFRSLWRHRDLTAQLAWRSFTSRYKGSVLGLIWSVLNPLVMLAIYTLIFGMVFGSRWSRLAGDGSPKLTYALGLFCGLVPFTLFSEVLNRSPHVVVGVPNYVKKVVFPLETLCVAEVLAALAGAMISLALLVVGCAVALGQFNWTLVYLPLAFVPLVMLTLGLSWFIAAIGVFLRDIGQIITLATQMLFYLTPIFYEVKKAPELMRPFLYFNPLTTVVTMFRGVILWGDQPNWSHLLAVTVVSAAVMVGGYAWFVKSRKAFSDVL